MTEAANEYNAAPDQQPLPFPMTRDFAKKKPVNKRKPATRKSPRKTSPQAGAPAWLWLLTGAALGAFVVFLAYLSGVAPAPQPTEPSPAQQAPVNANKAAEQKPPKPRFDFYTLLKENDVVVEPIPTATAEGKQTEPPQEYILQVGSFKSAEDADKLRAELILSNLEAYVETVTVRNGETWHRVVVGPFTNRSAMASARGALASKDINPLVMKRSRD